jgi:NADH-quinone oxidoreductase subunit M
MIQIVSHGLSTGALFILAGTLQERLHTRSLSRMGGLWQVAPRLGGASIFFALASLGLPGMGNFVGEFMVVLGVYPAHPGLAVAASLGFIFSTAYALRMIQRICFGENREGWKVPDLSLREMGIMALMMVPLLWLGLSPQPLIDRVEKRNPSVRETTVGPHAEIMPGDPLPPGRRK